MNMIRSLSLFTLVGIVMLMLMPRGATAATGVQPNSTPGRNGRIAFAAETDTSSQIYTIKPDGTDLRQITNVNGYATGPDWSPDGRRIAFELDDDSHAGIAVMNADGSNLHDLTPTGLQSQPAFTPDGHHLVYECILCSGGDGIFLMRDDGSDAPGRRLSTNPFPNEGDSNPEVSPDGRTVTFVRHQVEGQLQALFAVDIHSEDYSSKGQNTVDKNGRRERQITPYDLEVGIKHDWAPDGRHIVLTAHADFPNGLSANVATIRPNGSDLRMVTNFPGEPLGAFVGSYSPDGSRIVYRVQGRGAFELWLADPNGHDQRLIGTFPFAPRFIDWGPRARQEDDKS